MDIKKKYELVHSDREGLYRIKALKSFNNVKKGDIGGYVQCENNLSHDGNCWIYDNAVVRDIARVESNAQIYGYAIVRGNATVYDNVKISDYVIVQGNASVGYDARIWGCAIIQDSAIVFNNANIWGHAVIKEFAKVSGYARVWGDAVIKNEAIVRDKVSVCDNAVIQGTVAVEGNAEIRGDAVISSMKDYIVFKNWWSSGRYFTWTRSNNMWKVGCFFGTGEQLIVKAYDDSADKAKEYAKIVRYVESILNS